MKKIALEEHSYLEGFPYPARADQAVTEPDFTSRVLERLPDFGALRLDAMDKAGIEISVLSLLSPGTHVEPNAQAAITAARRVNDALAGAVERHPSRYRGFAALAMQAPKVAAAELERAVRELGFKGTLLNGHTRGVYLDDPCYLPFWERVAAPNVPIYLHPSDETLFRLAGPSARATCFVYEGARTTTSEDA